MRGRTCGAACLLWGAIAWAPSFATAQEAPYDEALAAKIDRLVERAGIAADGPGVAIFIRHPGKVRFAKGYGLANLETKAPVTPTTLFELASTTKPFTALATLILLERGKLTLNDDIRKFLPELPDYGPPRAIQICDLLRHTSGLPDYLQFENVPAKNAGYWTNEDYVGEFARQKDAFPRHAAPGEKYEYNNTNYMLLALVVQRVGGKPFSEFVRDEIFTPCRMTSSFICDGPNAAPPPGLTTATGYRRKQGAWTAAWGAPPQRHEELLTVGDGGIWSNLEDLARWDVALRQTRLLKPQNVKQSLARTHTDNGEANDYGFGWVLYRQGGKLIGYGHDGSWGGFRTQYYNYLAANRTTIVLSNRGPFNPDKFWYELDALIEKHGARP